MRGGALALCAGLSLCAATLGSACVEPESIELEGTVSGPFFTTAKVPMPRATVIDDRGRVMEPQPEIAWRIVPGHVARIDGQWLVPTANGSAELRASVQGLSAPARVGFSVKLVDSIDLKCPHDDCTVKRGERVTLMAYPLAQGEAIGDVPITWQSQDSAVLAHEGDGKFVALAAGTSRVTVSTGTFTGTAEVRVVAPTDRIIVTCESTGDSVEANAEAPDVAAGSACVMQQLGEDRLRLEAFAGIAKAEGFSPRWMTTDERVVSIAGGVMRGLTLGSAVVSVEVGALRASFPVEVQERRGYQRCVGPRRTEGRVLFRQRYSGRMRSTALTVRCTTTAALRCAQRAVASGYMNEMAAHRRASKCCCSAVR
jgi:hypothetical protein